MSPVIIDVGEGGKQRFQHCVARIRKKSPFVSDIKRHGGKKREGKGKRKKERCLLRTHRHLTAVARRVKGGGGRRRGGASRLLAHFIKQHII